MAARELCCRIPAALTYLAPLRQLVEAFCTDVLQPDHDEEQVYQVLLAVSELTTNIIRHAYRETADGAIEVRAASKDHAITLDFFDAGIPYTPGTPTLPDADHLAEGGYGAYIIQQCVDRVTYDRDDAVHNHWRLEKHFGGK